MGMVLANGKTSRQAVNLFDIGQCGRQNYRKRFKHVLISEIERKKILNCGVTQRSSSGQPKVTLA